MDGPAGSGKSTTARRVAAALAFLYLDTGALYRAVTLLALRRNVATDDGAALEALMRNSPLKVERRGDDQLIRCGTEDVTAELRSAEVERHVSAVSAVPEVRRAMLDVQRAQRRPPGLVAEGRDLGSVVFPDADLKIYLVADLAVRAERRALERRQRGEPASVEGEREALARRDGLDSGRTLAPLRRPEGAHLVDTSGLTIAEQTERVLELFRTVSA